MDGIKKPDWLEENRDPCENPLPSDFGPWFLPNLTVGPLELWTPDQRATMGTIQDDGRVDASLWIYKKITASMHYGGPALSVAFNAN